MISRSVVLERLPGVVALVLAATLAWFGRGLVPPFSYEPIGPRAFPMLLAAGLAINGLWMLFAPSRAAKSEAKPDENAAEAIIHGRLDEGDGGSFFGRPVLITLVAILAYALFFEQLGFPVATALMTLVIGRIFGGSWLGGLAVGIGMGIGLHLLFDRLLDVTLPAGLLSGLL
jgi:putative tricarboxylic transport membrane protein